MRRIAIVLAVLVLGTLAAAQQEPGTSTGDTQLVSSNAPAPDAAAARPATAAAFPDAPSAAGAEQTSDSASQAGENAPQERVISKRSFFFPEISTSHEPLTVGQKFKQFALNSSSGSALLGSAFSAGINQATNSPSGYGQGGEGYAKRFGSSMATRASSEFAGTFVIASLARQDPRYFVQGQGSFGSRLGHALSRVVVAPNDGGGYGFNWGGVFGPLAGETLANTWQPVHEQTGARTAMRWATDLAVRAGTNTLREFWPDIFRTLGLKKK